MSIVYRPKVHHCLPPKQSTDYLRRHPKGTLWRCEECRTYWVADGNAHWNPPWPFGRTARRIAKIEREATQ